ncbi:SET and MYND domain-containing protein 4-like [Lutzomyia longipalpis]|uniref:SET and MYND domain-containing protein 4-like n=1 Tax=Lutzomyia longipalpis TaxID=7200 RepID=UPI0024847240|nr:SET and MYND domain-containing protein 4-like [Lutzomyia longipalpis]
MFNMPKMSKDEPEEISGKILSALVKIKAPDEVYFKLKELCEKGRPNSEKIDCVYKLMDKLGVLPDNIRHHDKKSDMKAMIIRQEGNKFFKNAKYVEAVVAYNRSACYAVSNEYISIAIGNRSAAFFEMKMYQECIESIRLAREFGYPERLKGKLIVREASCNEELRKRPKIREIFVPEIMVPVKEEIPFVARSLVLRENMGFGRHVVTEEDIPAGTFIAIEEPYCKTLIDKDRYKRCATCFELVPDILIPCEKCPHTMFCSQSCKDRAFEEFHAVECPISGTLFRVFTHVHLLVFRTVIRAFLAFSDVETMAQRLVEIEKEQKNFFSFDWTKDLTPEERYTPIHNMITNGSERADFEMFILCFHASLMFYLLKEYCTVFSQRFLTTRKGEDLLKNLLYHHLRISSNAYYQYTVENFVNRESGSVYFYHEYAMAYGGFYSLLNHSCCPNVLRVSIRSATGIITVKNIKAGEQIFTCYEPCHHAVEDDISARRIKLLEKYNFICRCPLCAHPQNFAKLPIGIGHLEVPVQPDKCTFANAKEGFNSAVAYLRLCSEFFGGYHPVCDAEEKFRVCLNILCQNVTLEIQQKNALDFF